LGSSRQRRHTFRSRQIHEETKVPTKREKYYVIASLGKGLKVLELLARHGELGVSEVAAHLDTNRAGCHRFLLSLRDLGYVEKSEAGRYRLTFKMLELGMKNLDRFEIRHTAHPMMQELSCSFGETVNLGHWDGRAIVHLDKINSTEILRMDSGLGTMAPAYCTGLGKAILAYLPPEEIDRYLQTTEFQQLTPNTIVSAEAMRKELAHIREAGFAVDREELSIGLRCIGAPVFDYAGRPSFALSVSGPTHRMSDERIIAISQKIQAVCHLLSEKIGGAGFDRRGVA
jgi:DNA-binding IclR family transcriptional regulator